MNLIFAVIWLVAAAAIFISGDPHFVLRLGGTSLSGGWLALFFAVYNVARWWSRRSYFRQCQAELEAKADRERRHREERRAEEKETPDPNFNFTEKPQPEGDQR